MKLLVLGGTRFLIAISLMLSFASVSSQANDGYAYAYIGLTPDGQAQLVLNDATNTDLPTFLQILAVPEGSQIPFEGQVFSSSPNSLWAAFVFPSPEPYASTHIVQITNTYTGEIRNIGTSS